MKKIKAPNFSKGKPKIKETKQEIPCNRCMRLAMLLKSHSRKNENKNGKTIRMLSYRRHVKS